MLHSILILMIIFETINEAQLESSMVFSSVMALLGLHVVVDAGPSMMPLPQNSDSSDVGEVGSSE